MIEDQDGLKAKCLMKIEQSLNWGNSDYWSDNDFQQLSALIHESTHILLSTTTLKRVWGRVKYAGNPTSSTMNALAGFLGYDSWRSFVAQEGGGSEEHYVTRSANGKPLPNRAIILWVCSMALLLLAVWVFIFKKGAREAKDQSSLNLSEEDFSFSSESVGSGIPSSVVFTYDASKSPTDSVYIQQNWDTNRRVLVAKSGHTHTSIYFEPGHYNAKLVIGNQVVKEHPLLIPTDGWFATIANRANELVYLEEGDFIAGDRLHVSPNIMEKYGINPLKDLAVVQYYNVGNFEAIPVTDFIFNGQIKNNAIAGRDPCHSTAIRFFTERRPILFPLTLKGCISNIAVSNIDSVFSGKQHDFSGFGADLSEWVDVQCIGTKNTIKYYVNKQLAFEASLASADKHIMGMVFDLSGGGAVRHVRLESGGKLIFEAF